MSDYSCGDDLYDEMSPWLEPPHNIYSPHHQYYQGRAPPHVSCLMSKAAERMEYLPPSHLPPTLRPSGPPPPPRTGGPPPARPGGRRQLPPTPAHPSTLSLETLPTICITHSPTSPRNIPGPTNFPRLEISPSHSSTWSPSSYSLSSVVMTGSQSGPRLGASPSRPIIPR